MPVMTTQTNSPSVSDRCSAAVYDPFFWLGERLGTAPRRGKLPARGAGAHPGVGAGTGLNLAPSRASGIEELVLTEPDGAMALHLEKRAPAHHGAPVRVV